MEITITSDELRGNSVNEAMKHLNQEVDKESDLGERIRLLAANKNIGIGDLIELIVTHVFYEDDDYTYDSDN